MQIRHATLLDAPLLFRWRMDPETMRNSFSQKPFTGESHIGWLVERLASDDTTILIGDDLHPIGVVVFAPYSYGARNVGITVAPERRNQGYGKKLLRAALGHVNPRVCFAEIREHNIVSQRLFESCGFEIYEEAFATRRYRRLAPVTEPA
jgi:RimJ/RimL family protein N-acetyltransferase